MWTEYVLYMQCHMYMYTYLYTLINSEHPVTIKQALDLKFKYVGHSGYRGLCVLIYSYRTYSSRRLPG